MARGYNPVSRVEELRQRFETVRQQGLSAQQSYKQDYPQYRSAYDEAVAFEPQVRSAYDAFQANRTQARLDAYNALLSTYEGLQANYKAYEPTLQQYQTTMQQSGAELDQINEMLPSLLKQIEVERDPRKQGVRRGYQQSILTSTVRSPSAIR